MGRFVLLFCLIVCTAVPATAASCLGTGAEAAHREEAIRLAGSGVTLAGRLFLPNGPGPHPAVVLMQGGGHQDLNEAPLFYAPLLAQCGVAALVYDKRGTGASGGDWEAATLDDFIEDAAGAVAWLRQRADIDARRIGLLGFSQGGRLAPVVAARHGGVAFVVSVSGPFTSLVETRQYALEQQLRRRGLSSEALDIALRLWRRHFTAVAGRNEAAFAVLDKELREAVRRNDGLPLPPPSDRLPWTPTYNSMGRNYTLELRRLRVPMLAVYGERDAVVPVPQSIDALRRALDEEGNRGLEVIVVPFADHSFNDWTFNQRIRVEETILDWILTRIARTVPDADPTGQR